MNRRERTNRWTAAARRLMAAVMMMAAAGASTATAAVNDADPQHAAFALVANAAGTLFKATASGLHRSADGGITWTGVPVPGSAHRFLAVPAGARDALYLGGPGAGIARFDLTTGQLTDIGKGLPNAELAALAAHATQPDTLYAVLAGDGIWRTQDAGKTWERMDKRTANARRLIHTNLKGSMQTGWLYAITPDKIRLSMDCFCLWRNAGALPEPASAIAFDPSEPATMYAATPEMVFRSDDGGQNWRRVSAAGGGVVDIAVTRTGAVFVLMRTGAVLRSADRGATWEAAGA